MPPVFSSLRRFHFVGIGGAGMSGIAMVLHRRGYEVTGSDLKPSRYVTLLERDGIPVSVGHDAANLDLPDVVVISSAIPGHNPGARGGPPPGAAGGEAGPGAGLADGGQARHRRVRHPRQDHHHVHDQPRLDGRGPRSVVPGRR